MFWILVARGVADGRNEGHNKHDRGTGDATDATHGLLQRGETARDLVLQVLSDKPDLALHARGDHNSSALPGGAGGAAEQHVLRKRVGVQQGLRGLFHLIRLSGEDGLVNAHAGGGCHPHISHYGISAPEFDDVARYKLSRGNPGPGAVSEDGGGLGPRLRQAPDALCGRMLADGIGKDADKEGSRHQETRTHVMKPVDVDETREQRKPKHDVLQLRQEHRQESDLSRPLKLVGADELELLFGPLGWQSLGKAAMMLPGRILGSQFAPIHLAEQLGLDRCFLHGLVKHGHAVSPHVVDPVQGRHHVLTHLMEKASGSDDVFRSLRRKVAVHQHPGGCTFIHGVKASPWRQQRLSIITPLPRDGPGLPEGGRLLFLQEMRLLAHLRLF
mmetsp:Transcript_45169/g.98233  ORF Transcript_45169/g.98233 Transcript_45169/m.98233 type:complete len:387 (-) Transcript_45169:77-1237(-)